MRGPPSGLMQHLCSKGMTATNWTKKKIFLEKKSERYRDNPMLARAEAQRRVRGRQHIEHMQLQNKQISRSTRRGESQSVVAELVREAQTVRVWAHTVSIDRATKTNACCHTTLWSPEGALPGHSLQLGPSCLGTGKGKEAISGHRLPKLRRNQGCEHPLFLSPLSPGFPCQAATLRSRHWHGALPPPWIRPELAGKATFLILGNSLENAGSS